ncbi:hypothetical protein PsAD2_03343 [Pseudovibrio axinellae]|uniref:Uncharacterized protein n=1 Tax=Pseudovibrio axinellae TaxID=989403 RepID=A0A165WNA9_9HYPH|nr:hypothetical protein [Pseudovibrio axinellae]KZL16726.1 hypothetical protein PsAD2_03343 [Pseudovibrio axinellae]SEQ77175.1 hypothetical protein SAMN05421798_104167 [Pseudovibrio axinellae]
MNKPTDLATIPIAGGAVMSGFDDWASWLALEIQPYVALLGAAWLIFKLATGVYDRLSGQDKP